MKIKMQCKAVKNLVLKSSNLMRPYICCQISREQKTYEIKKMFNPFCPIWLIVKKTNIGITDLKLLDYFQILFFHFKKETFYNWFWRVKMKDLIARLEIQTAESYKDNVSCQGDIKKLTALVQDYKTSESGLKQTLRKIILIKTFLKFQEINVWGNI